MDEADGWRGKPPGRGSVVDQDELLVMSSTELAMVERAPRCGSRPLGDPTKIGRAFAKNAVACCRASRWCAFWTMIVG